VNDRPDGVLIRQMKTIDQRMRRAEWNSIVNEPIGHHVAGSTRWQHHIAQACRAHRACILLKPSVNPKRLNRHIEFFQDIRKRAQVIFVAVR